MKCPDRHLGDPPRQSLVGGPHHHARRVPGETGRDGAAAKRPIAQACGSLPSMSWHHGLRALAARMLSAAGYDVQVAASGDEALALIQSGQSPVDLVVTDVVMPGITGQMYRQFALVIAATALISAVNALTLKPTQCALWLEAPVPPEKRNTFYRAFNNAYDY